MLLRVLSKLSQREGKEEEDGAEGTDVAPHHHGPNGKEPQSPREPSKKEPASLRTPPAPAPQLKGAVASNGTATPSPPGADKRAEKRAEQGAAAGAKGAAGGVGERVGGSGGASPSAVGGSAGPSPSPDSDLSSTVFVRNLGSAVRVDEVRRAFGQFGNILSCRLVINPLTKSVPTRLP